MHINKDVSILKEILKSKKDKVILIYSSGLERKR